MNLLSKISYYFVLVLSVIFIYLSVTNIYSQYLVEALAHGTTIKNVIQYLSSVTTLVATIIIFVGLIQKSKWLVAFTVAYIAVIELLGIYRLIIFQNPGNFIAGTILNLLFLVPVLLNKKILFDGKLIHGWFVVGVLLGIVDFISTILKNQL